MRSAVVYADSYEGAERESGDILLSQVSTNILSSVSLFSFRFLLYFMFKQFWYTNIVIFLQFQFTHIGSFQQFQFTCIVIFSTVLVHSYCYFSPVIAHSHCYFSITQLSLSDISGLCLYLFLHVYICYMLLLCCGMLIGQGGMCMNLNTYQYEDFLKLTQDSRLAPLGIYKQIPRNFLLSKGCQFDANSITHRVLVDLYNQGAYSSSFIHKT